MDECGIPSSEEENDEQRQWGPGGVRLKRGRPWKLCVAVDALFAATIVESKVDDADWSPVHQGRDEDNILELLKGRACGAGETQITQAHEQWEEANR